MEAERGGVEISQQTGCCHHTERTLSALCPQLSLPSLPCNSKQLAGDCAELPTDDLENGAVARLEAASSSASDAARPAAVNGVTNRARLVLELRGSGSV